MLKLRSLASVSVIGMATEWRAVVESSIVAVDTFGMIGRTVLEISGKIAVENVAFGFSSKIFEIQLIFYIYISFNTIKIDSC